MAPLNEDSPNRCERLDRSFTELTKIDVPFESKSMHDFPIDFGGRQKNEETIANSGGSLLSWKSSWTEGARAKSI